MAITRSISPRCFSSRSGAMLCARSSELRVYPVTSATTGLAIISSRSAPGENRADAAQDESSLTFVRRIGQGAQQVERRELSAPFLECRSNPRDKFAKRRHQPGEPRHGVDECDTR